MFIIYLLYEKYFYYNIFIIIIIYHYYYYLIKFLNFYNILKQFQFIFLILFIEYTLFDKFKKLLKIFFKFHNEL